MNNYCSRGKCNHEIGNESVIPNQKRLGKGRKSADETVMDFVMDDCEEQYFEECGRSADLFKILVNSFK